MKESIAIDICELNRWKTPIALKRKFGRDLTQDEITNAMNVLTAYVPYEEWIKVWQRELDENTPSQTVKPERLSDV